MAKVIFDGPRVVFLMNEPGNEGRISTTSHERTPVARTSAVSGTVGFRANRDIDDDGDADVIYPSKRLDRIFVNAKSGVVGDANFDGVFNADDLVQVFQAGEFEDGTSNNSTFSEGDWNGDGDFTWADIVFAAEHGEFSSS